MFNSIRMKSIYALTTFVLLLLCTTTVATAQDRFWDKYTAHNISLGDGLQHNHVRAFCRDDMGYIWIATYGGGVSCYDGYDFVVYDVNTQPRLKSNFVNALVCDNHRRLWIGSDDGVDVFDLEQETVADYTFWPGNSEQLSYQLVSHMTLDADGNVWFTQGNKLVVVRLDNEGNVLGVAEHDNNKDFTAMSLVKGNVWVASYNKLYMPHVNDNDEITMEIVYLPILREWLGMMTAIYPKGDEVWIGTDNGLLRTNTVNGQIRVYNSDDNTTSLTQNRITDIAELPSGEIVVATLKGINIYNTIHDSFERVISENHISPKSISCNFVNSLFNTGQHLWLGTDISGIDVLTQNNITVVDYVHGSYAGSLSPNPVNAIVEDNEQGLWVGNVESGLNYKPAGGSEFQHFTQQNHGLPHNSISTLVIDGRNQLWCGTWGGGVCVIDLDKPDKPVVKRFNQFESPFIGSMIYDHINDGIWVGATRKIYFIKNDKVYTPVNGSAVSKMNGSLGTAIDDEGKLWFGISDGLLLINLKTMTVDSASYVLYNTKLDEPEVRINPRITCVYKAKDGTMYIGTNGYGFYQFDPFVNRNFVGYMATDGLVNNCVRGIAEDNDGNIWVSTSCGFSMFEPVSKRFVNYTTGNGMLSDLYYWNASYKSPSTGRIYFGSVEGLLELHRRINNADNTLIDKPIFTRLAIQNVPVTPQDDCLDMCISRTNNLELHERDKSFTLEFAALNVRNPQAVRYRYMLQGFDADWVDTDANRRYATYTNLPSGNYKLLVCCSDNMIEWSEAALMNITIVPYFYKTFWFYLLVMLVIVLIAWQIIKYRTRNVNEQRRLLNLLVQERTNELRQQKGVLEHKTKELEQQNIKLSEQNRQIIEQKESIVEMSNKIQKLAFDKTQFFTNITHEFRTPVTLIIGPVKRALGLSKDPQVTEQLQFIERSSHTLLRLVNQLMDFRKIESGNMEQHPSSDNLVNFINEAVHPFAVFASERNIRITVYNRMRTTYVMFDRDAMGKVLTNLLSNAVKFTRNNGRIDIYIASITRVNGDQIYLSISDNGESIPAQDLNRIFERFYQSDNQVQSPVHGQSGTGIGLYLCRHLIDQGGGRIWARNNKGGGCSFRITLPLIEGTPNDNPEPIDTDLDIDDEPDNDTETNNNRLKILIVEDNRDMRLYVKSILTDMYDVVEARNGVEGLTVLAEQEIDFIICDLMMPVMDGMDFARKVKGNFSCSHVPILILTAQMSDNYRTESYKIGVEAYLKKPFDEQMLLARISGILESRRANQRRFKFTFDTADLNIDKESSDDKFVNKVIEHIKQHYTEPEYSIDDILSNLACSKSMLNKKMQSVVGQSPGAFIRNYRLSVAKELILRNRETHALNISQIAYEVGFNDPKYFTRCFTKHFGITPSAMLDGIQSDDENDAQ